MFQVGKLKMRREKEEDVFNSGLQTYESYRKSGWEIFVHEFYDNFPVTMFSYFHLKCIVLKSLMIIFFRKKFHTHYICVINIIIHQIRAHSMPKVAYCGFF